MAAWFMLQLIGEEQDVSVYDIADHPDFRFRTTDIVIRIGNTEDGALPKEDEVGMLSKFMCWAVPVLPDTATSWLQEIRRRSLTAQCLRMAGMACIRDRQTKHLLDSGLFDPASRSLEGLHSAAVSSTVSCSRVYVGLEMVLETDLEQRGGGILGEGKTDSRQRGRNKP